MPKPKVVLDTNVVVSAHLGDSGYESLAFDLAISSQTELYVSPDILAEYSEVLRRPRLGIEWNDVKRSLDSIRERARLVNPRNSVSAAFDPDDNKFLECAEEARADYLVTGNRRHFPKQWKTTKIVNARELLELITPHLKR